VAKVGHFAAYRRISGRGSAALHHSDGRTENGGSPARLAHTTC